MAEFDDYESLPPSTSLSITMLAGAAAGISEHCAMFPIDSVKTRMQSLDCEKQQLNNGIRSTIRIMIQEDGLLRPMRGFSAMVLGAGPAHALYFSCYEHLKHRLSTFSGLSEFWVQGLAGVGATLCHDSVMTPTEVIKQRMQMCCSPFKSILTATRTIYKNEGVRAFYRSYVTSLSMNVPYQVSHFWTYEYLMSLLNPNGIYNPAIHFLAGASAGAVASTVTIPLDVCKTLLNTQEPSVLRRTRNQRIVGLPNAAFIIYRLKGVSGFFQGLQARVIYQMPATAISWSVYEFFKQHLRTKDEIQDGYGTLKDFNKGVDMTTKTQVYESHWDTLIEVPRLIKPKGFVLAEKQD